MLGKRTTGWVGIDVGAACVKTAQAVRRGGAYYIRAAAIVPRRQRWTPETLAASQPSASADEIRAAAAVCGRFGGRAAAAVLTMSLCETVQVEKPAHARRGGDELSSVVEAEMHQSLSGRVMRSWPADLQPGKLNVITAAAAWSDQLAADVGASRWNCRAIDALPWALGRAASMADAQKPLPTVAVLDWGYSRATMCLIHNGVPAIVRCLKNSGFSEYIATAQQALRVNATDAELVLQRHGLFQENADADVDGTGVGAVDEALADRLHGLEREIRRTLGYWQSQTRGTRPERLYLFGTGASLAGIDRRLSSILDLDVQRWRLPAERADGSPGLPPAHLLGPALAASALAWEDAWATA